MSYHRIYITQSFRTTVWQRMGQSYSCTNLAIGTRSDEPHQTRDWVAS